MELSGKTVDFLESTKILEKKVYAKTSPKFWEFSGNSSLSETFK